MEGSKPGLDERYCSSCRGVIKKLAELCVHCGVRVAPPVSAGESVATNQPGETGPVPHEERLQRLARAVSSRTLEGWNVIDRNDREVYAVLSLPAKPVNHILHLLVTLFTCGFWVIVWAIIAGTHRREQRLRISIDDFGNLLQENLPVS